jgi:hypothetical protein
MGKIADIREGLATAIATIDGLQAEPYVRDIADVPVAMVGGPDNTEFDKTFGRGHDDYEFGVIVFTSRVDDISGQTLLDSYLDPYGPSSIKAAIEASVLTGGSLVGVVDDLRVERTQEYGAHEVGGVTYYGAVVIVKVMAPGKES